MANEALEQRVRELEGALTRIRRDDAERRATRGTLGRVGIGLVLCAVVGFPVVASTYPPVPNPPVADEMIVADEVLANLDHLVAGISRLEEQTVRVRGEVCGETAPTAGDVGGYDGADALCAAVGACDAATAHICTPTELIRQKADGGAIPIGWFATGVQATAVNGDPIRDCSGFTSASASNIGVRWNGGNTTTFSPCDQTAAVICCHTQDVSR